MRKIVVLSLLISMFVVSAQTSLGNWTQQELSDPFIDEERVVIAIAEDAEPYKGTGPFFAVLCEDKLADVVYFSVGQRLFSGETREFDYRVNGGDIRTAQGWMNDSFVSLRTDEDDFAQFKEDVLVDDAELALSTVSSSGERVVTVFQLAGLDEALAEIGCVK